MSLVYYFDLGNTRGKLWRSRDGVIDARFSAPYGGDMSAFLSLLPADFQLMPDAVQGASVLDEAAQEVFSGACMSKWSLLPDFAQSSARHAGVISAYTEDPTRLGVDRWLALIAVRERMADVCVVDCGTAITLDMLRSDGVHLGGYILPGLLMMEASLRRHTARVHFEGAAEADGTSLGQSTREAVRHGALAAVVALIERVARGGAVRLVLTGGDAARVSACLDDSHECEPELLLHGLRRYFADAGIN